MKINKNIKFGFILLAMLGYYDLVVMQAVLCVFVVYDLLDPGAL